ncbi:MAG: MotE family protein [Roseburia sp.]
MAEEKEEEVLDKKAAKKAEKERKKAEKKKAKGNADDLDMEEETVGSKIAVFFVTLIIIIIWLAIIVLLIKWDVGGFGSTVLRPLLKDVPYVNKILPELPEDELSTEESPYSSLDEALEQIKSLELQLAEAQNSASENADYIAQLEAQAQELQRYKQDEAEFEALKEQFYEEVVFSDEAPDIEEYQKFYEGIDPANAEVLYKQVVEQRADEEDVEEYVKAYSSMKPKEAAAIFDTMTDNLKLVARILKNMDAQSRADILGKMNSETAAKVTEIMEP